MKKISIFITILILFGISSILDTFSQNSTSKAENSKDSLAMKFDFGSGKVEPGYKQVTGDMIYNKIRKFNTKLQSK